MCVCVRARARTCVEGYRRVGVLQFCISNKFSGDAWELLFLVPGGRAKQWGLEFHLVACQWRRFQLTEVYSH